MYLLKSVNIEILKVWRVKSSFPFSNLVLVGVSSRGAWKSTFVSCIGGGVSGLSEPAASKKQISG